MSGPTGWIVGAIGLLLAATPAGAQQVLPGSGNEHFPPEARRAVERGLAWLAAVQNADGSWNCKIGHKLYNSYEGEEGKHIGVTALACMAFLAAGNQPGRGRWGRTVQRGTDFILAAQRAEDGYITFGGSRMYSHAFATMYLSEIYGMTPHRTIQVALKRGVQCIVNGQNPDGGWRYSPMPVDADLSVTVSTLQALRSARNAGIPVPLDTIEKAQSYVRACAAGRGLGGFHYQKPTAPYGDAPSDERTSFALTACGIVSMISAGEYSAAEHQNGVRALERFRQIDRYAPVWGRFHYLYAHYYGMQAYYQMAPPHVRDPYRAQVVQEIVGNQEENGSWIDDVGPAYATAMACLVLQVPCEWLPIFQK
jgi:hypothetical protein